MDEQNIRFETNVIYTSHALKEANRGCSYFHSLFYLSHTVIIAAICLFIFYIYIWAEAYSIYTKYFFLLAFIFFASRLVSALLSRNGGIQYKRMCSNNSGKPVHQIIRFEDSGITCLNLDNQNSHSFQFQQIRSVAQTKNYLIVLLEYNQMLLVDKATLTGGSQDAFIQFLVDVCPKIKPKKLRSNTPGRITKTIMIVLWIVGLVLAVYRLPITQKAIETSREINNTMYCQQIAEKLERFGINVDDESISEIDAFYDSITNDPYYTEYYNEYSKVVDLLCYAGTGDYDDETWDWTPSSSGTYWLDMEVWNSDTTYSDFLRGVSALNPEILNFTDIQEDTSKVDWESGTGTQSVTFNWNNQSYCLNAQVKYDWFDVEAADTLNMIIRSNTDKQLYFAYDGGQGLLVFFADQQWAKDFEKSTGIQLYKKAGAIW